LHCFEFDAADEGDVSEVGGAQHRSEAAP
jgi:hypothetical protein